MVEKWRSLSIDAYLLTPEAATATLSDGDVALMRLDVLQSLDGIEPGLDAVPTLEESGVRIVNSADALVRAHDKLRSARALSGAGIPTPAWTHYTGDRGLPELGLPAVIKPRYGSWGRDVVLCETIDDVERCLSWARERPWFQRHGAMIEEYVPTRGVDRRVLVAAGRVVGTAERVGARGEWRTNVSLGGTIRAAAPAPEADELALAAVAAIEADFVGVDLIWSGTAWLVVELNGAVDFGPQYSLAGKDVFTDVASALGVLRGAPNATAIEAARAG